MLKARARWNLKAVLLVHVLRLVFGLIIVRLLYSVFGQPPTFIIDLVDRLVVIGLVFTTILSLQENLIGLGLSLRPSPRQLLFGVGAGIALLAVSIASERVYATTLLLTPTPHPLVAQVAVATRWRDLLGPLFLAGIAAPIAEEVLYRLFTFLPLMQRYGLWGGALASAAIFALLHFNAYWLAEMIVVGMGLAATYYYSGSLLAAIVAHAVINFSKIFMIYWKIPF